MMERETKKSKIPSVIPNNCGGDRVKRDEWSEGAVLSLLEGYEAKWVLRNRAKLKGHDWEEVARHVSARADHTKSPKTMTQCKNKIESMKKRYRSESDGSSWPLYQRLDRLLRGSASQSRQSPQEVLLVNTAAPLGLSEPQSLPLPHPTPPPLMLSTEQNCHGSTGVDREAKKEDHGVRTKSSEDLSEKYMDMETDSSTPAQYNVERKIKSKKQKPNRKKEESEIAGSIRCLADVVMRSEEARLETMKEIERLKAEVEAKRGEMDLKRTEIIANTQLDIARIIAAALNNKLVDSSVNIRRS